MASNPYPIPSDYAVRVGNVQAKADRGELVRSNQEFQAIQAAANRGDKGLAWFVGKLEEDGKVKD